MLSWITALHQVSEGQILAIDGKTLRGSYDRSSTKAAIQMVSVWATQNHLSLGSVQVDAKSNEITAIPQLLELIDVSGALVTIDAIGCQKEIARKIVEAGADFVLAVKRNQRQLHAALAAHFEQHLENDFADAPSRQRTTDEKGHGRQEQRSYFLTPVPEHFPVAADWPHLQALGAAIHIIERNGRETMEVRYYILSRYVSGSRFAAAVRGHWGIEIICTGNST